MVVWEVRGVVLSSGGLGATLLVGGLGGRAPGGGLGATPPTAGPGGFVLLKIASQFSIVCIYVYISILRKLDIFKRLVYLLFFKCKGFQTTSV